MNPNGHLQHTAGTPGIRERALGMTLACFSAASLGAFAWIVLRPEAFLIAGPLLLLSAPVALVCMVAFFRSRIASTVVVLVPLVLLMVDFNVRPGAYGPPGALDAQTLFKAVCYAVLLVHGLTAIARGQRQAVIVWLFVGYALLAACSTAYADSGWVAAGGGLALLSAALAVNTLSSQEPAAIERMWRNALIGLVAFAVISVALYFVLPGFAVASRVAGAGRLQGVTGAPNSLGPLMVVGILIGLYKLRGAVDGRQRLALAASLLALGGALALTGSRTAIGGFALTLAAMLMAGSVVFLWLALICGVFFVWIVAQPLMLQGALRLLAEFLARSGRIDELTTFTGRVEIWFFSFQKWLQAPWFGYGLGGPRRVISQEWVSRSGGTTGTAHNMLLESLMSVGAVGTIVLFSLVAMVTVLVLREYRRSDATTNERRLGWLLASVTIFILVDGLMEKSFAGLPSPQTIVLAMVCGSYLASRARVAEKAVDG